MEDHERHFLAGVVDAFNERDLRAFYRVEVLVYGLHVEKRISAVGDLNKTSLALAKKI